MYERLIPKGNFGYVQTTEWMCVAHWELWVSWSLLTFDNDVKALPDLTPSISPTGRVCESSMIMWCPVWIMGYRLLCFFMFTAASLKFGKSLQPWTCIEFQTAPVPEIRGSSYSPMKIANWTRCPIQMAIHCFAWNWKMARHTHFYSAVQVNPNHVNEQGWSSIISAFHQPFLARPTGHNKNWAVENVLWFAMFFKSFPLGCECFFKCIRCSVSLLCWNLVSTVMRKWSLNCSTADSLSCFSSISNLWLSMQPRQQRREMYPYRKTRASS